MEGKRAFRYSGFLSKEEKTIGRQRTCTKGATIGHLWGERMGNVVIRECRGDWRSKSRKTD